MKNKSKIKKLAIALLLLTISFAEGDIIAQCGAGSQVILSTQTQVNNFISNNCTNFLGFLGIIDDNNGVDNITDLTPLSTLTYVGNRLLIRNNLSLTNLNGLQSLITVNGTSGLLLLGNTALMDISGLSNLTTIGGNLTIQSNNMASFTGLDNLTSIDGTLNIINNDLLTDMTSLSSLTSIDGYLLITDNALLTSLSGLDNIISSTIISQNASFPDINIYDNPLLNECSVTSICNAYNNNNLTTNIMNNASGCNGNLEIITNCQTVPVEWLEPVVARAKITNIELRFSIAMQINNSHFEIEQSQDGINYHNIGEIEGAGSSSSEIQYQYSDEHPSIGKNYYRVKQVDFDGEYVFSNIASAHFKADEIKIYPNPASDELTFITNEEQEIRIYNQIGQMLKIVVVNKGSKKIDISEFNSGVYYLKIDGEIEVLIKK